ncbi:MAG: PDDEXK nuclease domain-containing protein [Prevotellaceae bacterium]|jgi:predicted nuclease of restriction endonuclease-like (RecB) superfamily|nr:PDDEXK nuclease domain-containing protein [Prevotellaceae bacterium]
MKNNKDYLEAVKAIKEAILRSQHRAVSTANREQLSLYYGIGRYVSEHSRVGFWGTSAIEQISNDLQKELPGLRGFSATSIKKMRYFYDEWAVILNRPPMAVEIEQNRQSFAVDLQPAEIMAVTNQPPMAVDLAVNENMLFSVIWPPSATKFNPIEFLQIGFSHHIEILSKTKLLDARLFYIHECAARFWSKYALRDYLKADLYGKRGTMPNNFEQTMPDVRQALKAISVFKDEYLLDYFNVEQYGERNDDIDERVLEQGIVANIRKFIMTFGQDFSFIGNQYRVEVAGEELFIDLLFFNRELNSLVAVELKSGKFRPSYLGQLNTYLSALDEYVRKPHENASIGIILCKEMNNTFVQFAVRDYSKPMGVATYNTSADMPEHLRKALPDIEELKKLL